MNKDWPLYKLNNGVEMPALGLGVFQSPPEQTLTAVRSAIDAGYRLIDTAALYMNEEQVGEGIRSSGIPRADIFVTTKLWMSDYGFPQTLHAFDRSARKLGLDYVDLYLIHWPIPGAFDATISSYRAMQKLLLDGRVHSIGVSNFSAANLTELIKHCEHIPAVNQVELHPFFSQPSLRDFHAQHGICTQAWSPIGGVNRYGMKSSKQVLPDPLLHSTVTAIALKYRKTPAQIILRWHIELGLSALPKSVRPARIRENCDVFDFHLTPDEVQSITRLDTGIRGGPDPDTVDRTFFKVKIRDVEGNALGADGRSAVRQ